MSPENSEAEEQEHWRIMGLSLGWSLGVPAGIVLGSE
jgi:hypothetical protein